MSFGDLLSLGLDLIPIVGNVKSGYELLTGKDAVTGEELNEIDKGLCALDLVPFGKFGKVGKRIRKVVDVAGTSFSFMEAGEQEVS